MNFTDIPSADEARQQSATKVLPEKVVTQLKEAIANHQLSVRIFTPGVNDEQVRYLEDKGYVCKRNPGRGNLAIRGTIQKFPDDYAYLDIEWK